MMQAILIDPYTQTIEVVEYSGDYKDISAMLGCDLFTTVYAEMPDTIYVDDEGLYVENQRYFNIKGHPQSVAGRGLVLGSTDDGDSTDCVSSLQNIQDMVEFCPEGTHVEAVFTVLPPEDEFDIDTLSDNELLERLGLLKEELQVSKAIIEKAMLRMLHSKRWYEN